MTSLERYEEIMDLEWFKEYLQKNLEPLLRPEIERFVALDYPVERLHHTLGQYLRNEWGFWGDKKTDLILWFNKIGIYHPDDMSSICIETYYRILNNKEINLNEQVLKYKKHWEEQGFKDGIYQNG